MWTEQLPVLDVQFNFDWKKIYSELQVIVSKSKTITSTELYAFANLVIEKKWILRTQNSLESNDANNFLDTDLKDLVVTLIAQSLLSTNEKDTGSESDNSIKSADISYSLKNKISLDSINVFVDLKKNIEVSRFIVTQQELPLCK